MTKADSLGPRSGLQGVRGWLLFLCIVLMVLLPLRLGLFLWTVLTSTRSDSLSEALTSPDSYARFAVGIVMPVAFHLLGIVGGVLLYREQRVGLRLVQVFLWLQILLAVLSGPMRALPIVLAAAAWLAYLFRSERVRNTYLKDTSREAAEVFR